MAQGATPSAGFGLDHYFLVGVVEQGDADVVVGEELLKLSRNVGQHLIGVQRRDGVARDVVQQRKLPRLGLLFAEQPRVFQRDPGLAGEHAHELEVAFIEEPLLQAVDRHDADGAATLHQRHAAKAAHLPERIRAQLARLLGKILSDQQRLLSADQVLSQVVAGRARALRQACPVGYLELEADFFPCRVVKGDVEIANVEQPPHLCVDLLKQGVAFQRRAERAPDRVQDVQLFRAPRGLLDQIAVFDSHADLVSQRQQQPQLGGRESPRIRSSQQQHAEGLLLGLQADGDYGAQALLHRQLPELSEGFFSVQRHPGGVTRQIAENHQAAQARHQADQVVIQALFLCRPTERVAQPCCHQRSGSLWVPVMKEKRACRNAHYVQHAIQRLGQHLLDFAANEARGCQIQV